MARPVVATELHRWICALGVEHDKLRARTTMSAVDHMADANQMHIRSSDLENYTEFESVVDIVQNRSSPCVNGQ